MPTYTTDQLKQSLKSADAAGDTAGARMIAQKLATQLADRGGSRGALATAAQGLSLGLADEIAGIVGGPGAQQSARQQVSDFRRESPMMAVGLEMAGALPTALASGAGLARLAQLPGRMGQVGKTLTTPTMLPQAALGGVEGAVVGAAQGTTAPERLRGGLVGATLGATAGGLAAPVAGAITRRLAPGMEAEKLISGTMRQDLGGRAPTPADLAMMQSRAEGQPQRTLAEVAGPTTEDLARTSAKMPTGGARQMAEEVLESRRRDMTGGLLERLGQDIGTDEAVADAAERLSMQARTDASPLYRAAYAQPFEADDELISLASGGERRKLLKAGYNRARQSEGIRTGEDLPTWESLVDDEGEGLESLTLAQWDQIKRGLDDRYRTVVRKNPSLAKDIWEYRRQVVTKLDELGPDEYRQARAAWAGPKAQEEALEEGAKVFSNEPEQTANLVRSYSGSERDAFLISAAQQIRKKLQSVPPEGGMPRFTDYQEDQIRSIFQDETAFNRFWEAITSSRDMQRFRNMVLSGSPTAEIMASQEQAGRALGAAGGIGQVLGGQPAEGVRTMAANLLPRRSATIPESINDPLSKMLFSQGAAIPPVLQRLQAPPVIPRLLGPVTTLEASMLANQAQRPRQQ